MTFRSGLLHTRIDYLLTSPDWVATDGAVAPSESSDHRLIWADLAPAAQPKTTRPATSGLP